MTTRTMFIEAPDFELADVNGISLRLSNYRNHQHVVLALLRGLF